MNNNDFMLSIIAALNKQLSAKSIQNDLRTMDNKFYVKVLAKLTKTLATKELQNQLKELNNLYVQVGANVKVNKNAKSKIEQNIKMLQTQISDLEIGLKASKTQQAKLNSDIVGIRKRLQSKINSEPLEFKLEIKKQKLISDIEYLGKRYSKLFSNTSSSKKYENLMQNALLITGKGQLADTRTELAAFTSELKANGLASKSTADRWAGLFSRAKDLFSAASVVRILFTQMRQAISSTLELDTAMTGLYKVQNDVTSREQFSGMLTKWNKLAQELSVTTESLINSASEWSKIGFGLDMSEQLAQITSIFEKTAEISNEQASKTLISGAQAFTEIDDLGEEDYVKRVEAIGNKVNAIGNKYAISSEGIADALQNSSAALKMANNDLDESIALITAGNKIFQSPDEMGNTLKVVSARLRGQKGELEALNEDTEGLIEGVSKVQTQILNLTGNKVNIFESDNETLKSTYDIMLEVGKVLDSLSDKDSASLLEIMFGKQRMSAGASILLNYEELEKVKNDSMNAANSMADEYAKYMESAEAHITTFKEKLVETYSTFMSGDTIKYATDFGSAMLDILNYTDLLRHGLLAIASIKIGQGISTIGLSIADAATQMNTLGGAIQKINSLSLGNTLGKTALEEIGDATKGLTDKNLKLLLSQKQLTVQEKIAILSRHNLTEEEARAKLEKMGLISATNAQTTANTANTTSTFTLSGALTALKASAIGAGQAMKAAFLSNPVGIALMAITTIVSVASTALSNHKQKLEETRRANIEAADSASDAADNLRKLYGEYSRLNSIQDRTTTQEDEYKTVIEDITSTLGERAEALKTLKQGTEEYTAKLKELTQAELQEQYISAVVGRKSAEETLQDTIWSDWNGSKVSVDSNSKGKSLSAETQQAVDIVSDALKEFETINRTWNNISWEIGSDNPDVAVGYYNALLKARTDLVNSSKDNEALLDTQIYKDINHAVNSMSDGLETYINKRYEELKLDYLVNDTIPTTVEEYQKLEEIILKAAEGNKSLQSSFKDLLAEDFSELYSKMQEKISDTNDLDLDINLSISDTLSKLNTELKPAFDSLKSAYNDIFTTEDGKEIFSIENLDLSALTDLQEKFNDVSGFDTFLRTVTNLSSTSDMVHDAFDNLAASFLYSQDTLENLNESTASAVIQQLNLLGVNNSQELVTEALTAKTEALALQKQILATEAAALSHNIDFNIISFLDEAGASDLTRQTLFKLIAAEQAFNNQELSTEGKIEKLNELAAAYGNTAIQSMTASAMVQMEHNGNFDIDKALADIQSAVNEINGVQIDFKGNSNKSAASKSGKKTADAWLEAYKKELAELEHIHDMEEITDREFYENLRDLNEKYFNDTSEHHEKYLDEYRSNEEKVAKGLKDVWTKYWEDYKSDLDKVSSYAERVLSRQIDSLKDKQDNEIDGYDGEMDAIDDKIKALEEKRKTVERNYQGQIDAIQKQIDSYNDEIDKLKEISDEKNRQLKLEQDIYELERLRNQKTQKEYVEGRGIVYKVDSGAIRDQEQQVENDRLEIEIAGYEKLIKGLEAQQDSLKAKMDDIISSIDAQIERLNDQKDGIQDKIDAVNKSYESQIEALEKYKDKWSEVSEHQSMLEEEAIARQLFGANAETAILEMRTGILDDYIGRYQMASDNLAMISEAKLHDISGILAQMQTSADTVSLLSGGLQDSFVTFQTTFSEFNSAANTVDTTNVRESLSTAGTVADSTSGQLENITTKLNELAAEVSSFTLPPLNTEQFTASLGTADSATGILGQLRTFTERFRELCMSIPTVWNGVLSAISGSGLVSGEDRDYNALFTPLLAAMDNCKFQMDTKLAEYVTAWTDFNMDLGGVIGTGGDSGTSSGGDKKSVKDARKPKGGNKENGDISTDSIVGTIQSGGNMINAVFDDTWVPGFKTMGEQINEICQKVVECVNEMAENTVDACRKAVDAINKANAAKKSSSSSNEKPEKFRGNIYTGRAFARGTLPLKQNVDDALVGELGAEIVTNTETGGYRIVGRNGAEFTDLNKGDVVISHTQTEQILRNNSLDYLLPQFKDVVLSPELMTQYIKPQFKNPINEIKAQMNMQLGAAQKARDERTVNITQDISVTLPNVTNETGFNNFKRELLEMKNDAIQRIHMR